ncbi:MAG TPA: hypothetical protein VFV98_04290, partial [Vicinamibacterales bacterium]|nr:hypothetical protein [Vicinamibacterales bacterium]
GGGGRGGPGGRGTTVNLTAQLQWRRNNNDSASVFPQLGGQSTGSSLAVPVSLTIQHGRTNHNISVNIASTKSNSFNRYAYIEDVAGNAGVGGVATDPFDWGVPALNFSTYTDLRDVTPARRTDTRLTASYAWTRPVRTHTIRFGGDLRSDWAHSKTDTNARGTFIFTGTYAADGGTVARGAGMDFADFLLGMPQQATIQYLGNQVSQRGRSLSAFLQDDWRKNGNLTFNLGVRYELIWPTLETTGQMVNLDVNSDFTAAVPVISGQSGPFTGAFPKSLIILDGNNIAPRAGFAWRAGRVGIVRGGYGVSYNSGSYATIGRSLIAQPPFAVASTSIGSPADPLTLQDPFANVQPDTTTNTFGIDKNYVLGRVQTWNVDLSKTLRQVWDVGAGYTGTKGSSLDMLRAPNRGPDGLRIPDVQAFNWQSSEASSMMNGLSLRLARRAARGIGGSVSYTLAKSRDNASTLGGGRTSVAQNDQDLDAEWGLSSFDRRHQLSANASIELPFGPNRPWLNGGGWAAAIAEGWRANVNFAWQSGAPYTPTVSGAASDVARGTNGTLRADYNGAPIQLSDPTIDHFFNTAAFSIPAADAFGTAGRNIIIGPGSKSLNASFSRDVRMGGNRAVTVDLNVNNLLNLVQYSGLDTNANSPTFGQITSVRPMRSMTLNFRVRF